MCTSLQNVVLVLVLLGVEQANCSEYLLVLLSTCAEYDLISVEC